MKNINNYLKHKIIYLLNKYNIPLKEWSKGSAKSVDNLIMEIENEETTLKEEGENLFRYIEFVGINIFYNDGNTNWKLVEKKQIFNDGRVRVRNNISSVSEKMKKGENPKLAAIRGIEEELSIKVDPSQIIFIENKQEEDKSKSYPGLTTKYNGYYFNCNLNSKQFKKEGYLEEQYDKKTFFNWIEI